MALDVIVMAPEFESSRTKISFDENSSLEISFLMANHTEFVLLVRFVDVSSRINLMTRKIWRKKNTFYLFGSYSKIFEFRNVF